MRKPVSPLGLREETMPARHLSLLLQLIVLLHLMSIEDAVPEDPDGEI